MKFFYEFSLIFLKLLEHDSVKISLTFIEIFKMFLDKNILKFEF
jgi:hypothetical protein